MNLFNNLSKMASQAAEKLKDGIVGTENSIGNRQLQ